MAKYLWTNKGFSRDTFRMRQPPSFSPMEKVVRRRSVRTSRRQTREHIHMIPQARHGMPQIHYQVKLKHHLPTQGIPVQRPADAVRNDAGWHSNPVRLVSSSIDLGQLYRPAFGG